MMSVLEYANDVNKTVAEILRKCQNGEYTEFEMQKWQDEALCKLSENSIALNLLFNANCYGKDSQSRAFFHKIGNTIDFIKREYGLNSVTTTSPLIAKFIKNNFEDIEVRASVNMEIGTIPAMEYVAEYFDSFYMKREYNRDFDRIKMLKGWQEKVVRNIRIYRVFIF